MITVNTMPDLQLAINAGEPAIDISGQVDSADVLNVSQADGKANMRGMTRIRGGRLVCPGVVVGAARRLKFEGVEVWASGHALQVMDAIHVFIEDSYFRSPSVCLAVDGLAGMWVRSSHFNGSSAAALGLRVGASLCGYEALDVSDSIFEECHTDVRIGGGVQNCVNFRFARNWHDRPRSAAYLIAPSGGQNARNIRIESEWINGCQMPVVVSMGETTGRVDRLILEGVWELLGCGPLVTIYGDTARADVRNHATVVTGPLEPGS